MRITSQHAHRPHRAAAPALTVAKALTVVGVVVGLAVAAAGTASAMSGGEPVLDDATAPWVATLATVGDAPLLQRAGCGGALVAPDRVLTAAHCVLDGDPSRTEVHVGARVLSGQPGQVRRVDRIATLPGFALLPSPVDPADASLSSARRDLAVVILDRPVTKVRPLPVAAHRPPAGRPVSVFAHGSTGRAGAGEYRNDVLHRGRLTTLGAAECAAATPAAVDQGSVLCARGPETGACFGDSGSPLVDDGRRLPSLLGVFSFGGETAGRPCTDPFPEYFTDVTAFRAWIAQRSPLGQPYPAGSARITGGTADGAATVGAVLSCAAPAWDATRGGLPDSVGYLWATITRYGSLQVPTPVEGATGPGLAVTAALAGTEVVCGVTATNAGGRTLTISSPILVNAAGRVARLGVRGTSNGVFRVPKSIEPGDTLRHGCDPGFVSLGGRSRKSTEDNI